MKSRFRSTYILLGIFLILFLIVVFFENDGADKKKINERLDRPVFTQSQLDSLDKITFISTPADESAELVPGGLSILIEDELWTVEGQPVDAGQQDRLWEMLRKLPAGKVVSKNKANWDKYGLTDDLAKKALLYDGDNLISTLYFGSPGTSYVNVHIRWDDIDEVHLVKTDFAQFFDYDMGRWKNKSLFLVDKENISGMTVRVGEERWVFTADGDDWFQVSDLGTVSISLVDEFDTYLDNILELKGNNIETDMSLFGEADNALALTLRNGDEYVVSIDSTDEDPVRYFAMTSAQTDLISISSDYADRFRPDFLKINSPDDSDNPDEVLAGKSVDVDSELVE